MFEAPERGGEEPDAASLGRYSFVTTAKASADAHALVDSRWSRVDRVADVAAILAGMFLAVAGQPLGLLLSAAAGIALLSTWFHPLQRWLIGWRFRSLLGRMTTVRAQPDGLAFESELGKTFVPWSSVQAVRANRETVAFVRDRVLLGYVPAVAFPSAAAMGQFVDFAKERVESDQESSVG